MPCIPDMRQQISKCQHPMLQHPRHEPPWCPSIIQINNILIMSILSGLKHQYEIKANSKTTFISIWRVTEVKTKLFGFFYTSVFGTHGWQKKKHFRISSQTKVANWQLDLFKDPSHQNATTFQEGLWLKVLGGQRQYSILYFTYVWLTATEISDL